MLISLHFLVSHWLTSLSTIHLRISSPALPIFQFTHYSIHPFSTRIHLATHSPKYCLFTHHSPFPSAFQACVVCGDHAPFLQPSAALVCDSCRAFFWRSVVDASYKDFACANSWGCMVTVSARRACQACRLVLQGVVLTRWLWGFL